VRVAAYQAPYLPFGSWDAVDLIASQMIACESAGVELRRRPHDPRGWDGHLNPDVSGEYAALLGPP